MPLIPYRRRSQKQNAMIVVFSLAPTSWSVCSSDCLQGLICNLLQLVSSRLQRLTSWPMSLLLVPRYTIVSWRQAEDVVHLHTAGFRCMLAPKLKHKLNVKANDTVQILECAAVDHV